MTENANVTDLNDRIRQEHDELRTLLGDVHHLLADTQSSTEQIREQLRNLSEHVGDHFKQEETDGFFDQLVQDAPRLASRVDALRTEHTRLLEAMHQMKQAAAATQPAEAWRTTLEADFHAFSKQLMSHESKENELLQDAYGTDIGSKD